MKTSYANIFIKSDSNYKSVLDESKNITSKVDENYSSSQKLEKLLVGRKISQDNIVKVLQSKLDDVSTENNALKSNISKQITESYKRDKFILEEAYCVHDVLTDIHYCTNEEKDFIEYLEIKQQNDTLDSSDKKPLSSFNNDQSLQESPIKNEQKPIETHGEKRVQPNLENQAINKKADDYVCLICTDGDSGDDNLIIFCSGCNICVHQKCYGIPKVPDGDWYCDVCVNFGPAGKYLRCPFCTCRGGAMKEMLINSNEKYYEKTNFRYYSFHKDPSITFHEKPYMEIDYQNESDLKESNENSTSTIKIDNTPTNNENENYEENLFYNFYKLPSSFTKEELDKEVKPVHSWCHLSCALWIPEVNVTDEKKSKVITGVNIIDKKRWQLQCMICKSKSGAAVQCFKGRCQSSFHAECARRENIFMEDYNQIDNLRYTIFCEKHIPLKVKRTLESKVKFYVDEITKFVSKIGKFYNTYGYKFDLNHDQEAMNHGVLRSVNKLYKKNPDEFREREKLREDKLKQNHEKKLLTTPFFADLNREINQYPDFGFIWKMKKDNIETDEPEETSKEHKYTFLESIKPKKFLIKSMISKNHPVWNNWAKNCGFRPKNLYLKYKKYMDMLKETPKFEVPTNEKSDLNKHKQGAIIRTKNKSTRLGDSKASSLKKTEDYKEKIIDQIIEMERDNQQYQKLNLYPFTNSQPTEASDVQIKKKNKKKNKKSVVKNIQENNPNNLNCSENYFLDNNHEEFTEDVFCICRRYWSGEVMIECEVCENWFHPKCIGVEEANDELLNSMTIYCNDCKPVMDPGIQEIKENIFQSENSVKNSIISNENQVQDSLSKDKEIDQQIKTVNEDDNQLSKRDSSVYDKLSEKYSENGVEQNNLVN